MKKIHTICWNCKNACCGCEWSKNYTPIQGWDAIPTQIYVNADGKKSYTDSFIVQKCPNFERG